MKKSIKYIEQTAIAYTLFNMRPNSVVNGYFDSKLVAANIQINSAGSASGTINVPARTLEGSKKVEFFDEAETTAVVATFNAGRGTLSKADLNLYKPELRLSPLPSRPKVIEKIADNLAQTFKVNSAGGAFITSVDLYIASYTSNTPISIHIAEVENGAPTSKILPLTQTSAMIGSNVSDNIEDMHKLTITFQDITYLEDNKEYALVVYTNDSGAKLWQSTVGETDLVTGNPVSRPKYNGRLYRSQNSYTWTLDNQSDIKFAIHKAKFSTTSAGIYNTINASPESFSLAHFRNSVVKYPKTDINYTYSLGTVVNEPFQMNTNLVFDSHNQIDMSSNRFSVRSIMSTSNENISPIINKNRTSAVLASSIINPDITDGAYHSAGVYVSKDINLKNSATNLKVIVEALQPKNTSLKVYFKTIGKKLTNINFVDNERIGKEKLNSIIGKTLFVYKMDISGLIESLGNVVVTGFVDSKIYIKSATDNSIFNPSNTASDMHFLAEEDLDAQYIYAESTNHVTNDNVYSTATGHVYKKLNNNNTASSASNPDWKIIHTIAFDDIGSVTDTTAKWRNMTRQADFDTGYNPENSFIEYSYNPEVEPDADFTSFAVKIEMFVDPTILGPIPKIKNLRAIGTL